MKKFFVDFCKELICHKRSNKIDDNEHIHTMVRAFANGQGNQGSIRGRVIQKT